MTKKIDENKKIAILYANFRGKRRKIHDWIYLAEITKELSEYYGSYKKLSEKLGISNELVRETLKLLELPKEVKKMISERKINHEVAWRISSIDGEKNQIRVAKAIYGLNTHDGRDVVRVFRNNPELNIEGYVETLKKSKDKIKKINLIVIPLDKNDYSQIKEKSQRYNISINKFISKFIIQDWLEKNRK